jgi:CO dehydrogenase nickel-insertion accessory protein CooC1
MPPPLTDPVAARQAWVFDTLDRRLSIVETLVTKSREPLDWLALQRQVRHFMAYASPPPPNRPRSEELTAAFDRHVARLRELEALAEKELTASEPDALAEARRRLGLRLALIGKGGAGKTVISSTLARTLARRGRKVFAVDLDTCPGLAFGLGIPVDDAGLPPEALEEQPAAPYGWQLAAGLSPDEAVRQILMGFAAPDTDVIADLEAGPTTPFENYHEFADDVVVVVGPAWRSAMTARRLLPMVGDARMTIVANRFRDEPDHPGLAPAIRIPNDPDLTQAEREGRSPFEACPDSPAVQAIARLADLLLA